MTFSGKGSVVLSLQEGTGTNTVTLRPRSPYEREVDGSHHEIRQPGGGRWTVRGDPVTIDPLP